jgi:hypothetical protein
MYFRSIKKFLEVFGKSRKGKRFYSAMGRIWPIGHDTADARLSQLGPRLPSGRTAHASSGRRVVVGLRRRGTGGARRATSEAAATGLQRAMVGPEGP